MIRSSIPWLIDVFSKIEKVKSMSADMDRIEMYIDLSTAKRSLDQLYRDSVYVTYLRVSAQKADELAKDYDELAKRLHADFNTNVPEWEVASINSRTQTYLEVLKSELATIPNFLVLQKGSHDVGVLTTSGEAMFPSSTVRKVPDTLVDMKEAAKALAFELPTACGFHTFRVLESVLRSYWNNVTNDKCPPKSKTIGAYAEELKKGPHGEAKVWEALKQLKDLHRNPLAHPEVILDIEEAIGTIGMVNSVIAEMLRSIPDAQETTQISVADASSG